MHREFWRPLYTVDGDELTAEDEAASFKLVISGQKSKREQEDKSKRVLEGKLSRARQGQWQGGHVPFAMDVACIGADGKEKWRVQFEGRTLAGTLVEQLPDGTTREKRTYDMRRLKVNIDGSSERYDGHRNFPAVDQHDTLELRPTRNQKLINAAQYAFDRYDTEATNYNQIATHFNRISIPHLYADLWEAHHIREMLANPIYIGRQRYNANGQSQFFEFVGGERRKVDHSKKNRRRAKEDLILSHELFKPVIDPKQFDRVQKKLEANPAQRRAPKSADLWLTSLLVCATCNKPMRGYELVEVKKHCPKCRKLTPVTSKGTCKCGATYPTDARTVTRQRIEYICQTYAKAQKDQRKACTCQRNAVAHDRVEKALNQWISDTGQIIRELSPIIETISTPAEWQKALTEVAANYMKMQERVRATKPTPPKGTLSFSPIRMTASGKEVGHDENPEAAYRQLHARDSMTVQARLDQIDTEHSRITDTWHELPTPRAKEKAKAKLIELEAEMKALEDQQRNAADEWRAALADLTALESNWKAAQEAMEGGAGRRKADAIRRILSSIVCEFAPTGKSYPTSELQTIDFRPISGDSRKYPAGGLCSREPNHSARRSGGRGLRPCR